MDAMKRQMLARALLGNGGAGQAADIVNARAEYDMMVADGMDLPPFEEWLAMRQQMAASGQGAPQPQPQQPQVPQQI